MNVPELQSQGQVLAEQRGAIGLVALNRPSALNSLTLPMVRDLAALLRHWQHDDSVQAVVVRGAGREGKPPAFCAGGDIRWFRQMALEGNPLLEDFFTEEYALNHQIHQYPKLYVALMDGVCMGGGMGIAQGAGLRVVSELSRLAMPETHIGLFPDVGGGWFLARCPGRVGEFLGCTGVHLDAADSLAFGLADVQVPSARLPALVEALCDQPMESAEQVRATVAAHAVAVSGGRWAAQRQAIDRHFSAADMPAIVASLEADGGDFATQALGQLAKGSPLMQAVTLEQVRRSRSMTLADALRQERALVRHSFHLRPGAASETAEGIRALVVDKDHSPRWNPAQRGEVTAEQVAAFFHSPWPAQAHPLRDLLA